MKIPSAKRPRSTGASLIEAIIAVGVLSVAVPLVFGTMAETGDANLSAQAETRSSWMVPACLDELQLALRNESEFLEAIVPGAEFPTSGVAAIAFSAEGKPVGKVGVNDYQKGVREISKEAVRYVASVSGELPPAKEGIVPNLQVKIAIEYPASAPAAKRQKLEFFTSLP